MDLLDQILDSGLYAIVILSIMATMSLGVWGITWIKWKTHLKNSKQNQVFLKKFSSVKKFVEVQAIVQSTPSSPIKFIAQTVLEEVSRLSPYVSYDSVAHRSSLLEEGIQRAVEEQRIQEEQYLSFLSMTASLSPFLGLLGTVWGIMVSFFAIGAQGSAELSVVAPGIAAALITTVGGLIVAIPASAALNYFTSKNNKNEVAYLNFGSQMLSLFKRGDLQALETHQ